MRLRQKALTSVEAFCKKGMTMQDHGPKSCVNPEGKYHFQFLFIDIQSLYLSLSDMESTLLLCDQIYILNFICHKFLHNMFY